MSRLVDVLEKADAGDVVGVAVVIAAGFLALDGILRMNITEIVLAGLLVPIKYDFDGEDDLAKISAREISRRLDGKSEGIRVEVCVDRKIDITGEHESGGNTNQYEGVGLIKFLRG